MDNLMNNIRDVFSIFHDGGIIDFTGDLNKLTLKIQCNYLAELISPKFENFYIELTDIKKLDFDPWMNPIDLTKRVFDNYKDYLKANLDIISAGVKDDDVLITCYQHNTDLDYCGGNLTISANEVKVYDHDNNLITIEQLDSVCRLYWNKFGK